MWWILKTLFLISIHISPHMYLKFLLHYTSHSLLNYVHVIVCFFFVWPTKFENTLSFMQNVFNAWEFNRKDWKYQCLENWVQNLCFWKTFHLILMHYFHQIQCFEEFLHKIALIFQIFFFLEFWSIEPIFQSIKIAIKNFDQPLFVSIDAQLILDQSKHFQSIEPNFWSIENHIESF